MMAKKTAGLEIYRSLTDRLYYWRLKAMNGKVIADGAEGYTTMGKARAASRMVRKVMADPATEETNTYEVTP